MKPEPPPRPPKPGLSRRNLLIAAGGATSLAVGWAVWPRAGETGWAAAEGETLVNAWLKIGADGRVVVAIPQAEMGQGIWSGLAQIAADELGADWRAVGVEPAPLAPAYANVGLVLGALGDVPGVIQAIATRVVRYHEFQLTGGSTSVRAYEAPLRSAAAAAREMLCRAAARRWDVDWEECDTAGGFVTYKANRLAFGALAGDLRIGDAPETPALRARSTLAGKPVLRLDIPGKTDGSAVFGADIRLPGMAYAAIAQGPIGAKRTGIDKSGLAAGVTLVEAPDFVATVAEGWWAAKSALEALTIRYATASDAPGPWLEAAVRGALDKEGDTVRDEGDVAGTTLTVAYSLPFLAHACLEPMTATARIVDGRCDIWAPTQSASLAQWAVARALGIAESDVTIHPTLLGGGFGRKVEKDACVQAALIARAAGRPVQLIWSREEDTTHDMYRPAVAARMKGAAGKSGVTAWDAAVAVPDVAADVVARNLPALPSSPKAGASAIEGAAELPYDIANVRVAHHLAASTAPLGFWRSVGFSFTGFINECFVDELAFAAKVDPGAFRLAMLKDKPRHAAVLRAALKAGGPLGRVAAGIGRGVALVESFGTIVAQVAEVRMEQGRPRCTRVWAAVDCGRVINPDSVRAQIESGIIFGLTAALHGRISFQGGRAEQQNFDTYPLLAMAEAPAIETILIASAESPGGIGEPGTPPIAPAVANALFAATGRRYRDLPIIRS